MNIAEALTVVLELANQGALEDQDASGDESLEAELHKQHEAIEKIENLCEKLSDGCELTSFLTSKDHKTVEVLDDPCDILEGS